MIERLIELERRLAALEARLASLQQTATQNAQSAAKLWNATGGGGGGGGTNLYVAVTGSGGIPAASAAPSGGTPGSASCNIYSINSGGYTSIATGVTVYNPYLSATAAAVRVVTVYANADGTFTLLGESCV